MKASIERVQAVRSGTEMLLTVTVASPFPRTHTYRIPADKYLLAGSPAEGEVLDGDTLALLTAEEDVRLAYARAVKILAAGDNTRHALIRKLSERGFSRECAAAAVERLEKEGYIREEELLLRQLGIYAKRRWGPKKFLPNLIEKGFARADIERALVRAKAEGIYDTDEVKACLLSELPSEDASQKRAWLYKHGF
ncbi:MAG: hypothetical protein E7609_06245 [Ruminococcaceae bacterium]|nr:hypothetical protein [Oscillospiraceae bacterium]